MKTNIVYLSSGGNRHASAADWDLETGVLAYGAGRNLALWSPKARESFGIHALIPGHTGNINAVRFLSRPQRPYSVLLTGDSESTIRVWKGTFKSPKEVELTGILAGHAGAINCLATLPPADIAVSGAADGLLKVWRVLASDDQMAGCCLQTIKLYPKCFALSLALHFVGEDGSIILAVGGTRTFIEIYIALGSAHELTFLHKATLTGHEGWVRSLELVSEYKDRTSDLLLASASQDKYIRLWRLSFNDTVILSEVGDQDDLEIKSRDISNKPHEFAFGSSGYSLSFEALLSGHEDWVYMAKWHRAESGLQLLSSSADNSLATWEHDSSSGLWVCSARLGDISAQKGSTTATGSAGGFWAGLWSPDGSSVVSLGRTGSWRQWEYIPAMCRWEQHPGVSGHIQPVRSLAWSRWGSYLLSASADQTTRLHAPWVRENLTTWHELGRPQIHGYDLSCIDTTKESQFVSGAEEKLFRVFDQPRPVAELLNALSGGRDSTYESLPETANIPVLGLSNKAKDISAEDLENRDNQRDASNQVFLAAMEPKPNSRPTEDWLSRHTLWPETEKVYGHSYEISALTCSQDGMLVATACKASSVEHAVIRLHRTEDWRETQSALKAHTLTVTCLSFRGDDRYLLSVGRDRKWCIYVRTDSDPHQYDLVACNPKGHSRMILGCSWAPPEAGNMFATASRDKSIKLWSECGEGYSSQMAISTSSAVTSIDFCKNFTRRGYLLAAGLENGEVFIHIIEAMGFTIGVSLQLNAQ